jgi:hypothetical protein
VKRGTDRAVGLGVLALLPICCIGLPLLAAASISVAALAWGGAAVGAVVAIGALSVVLLRRRSSAGACPAPDELRAPRATRVSKEVAKR